MWQRCSALLDFGESESHNRPGLVYSQVNSSVSALAVSSFVVLLLLFFCHLEFSPWTMLLNIKCVTMLHLLIMGNIGSPGY